MGYEIPRICNVKTQAILPRRIQSAHEALFQACRNDALIVIAQPSWRSGNWNLHIPTSGRSVCTLGGVAAPGSIPARDTHSQGRGSRCLPRTHCCTYCQIVDMILHLSYVYIN